MDGRKVAAAVKAESPTTPVLLLTGWGQRIAGEHDVLANVDGVLDKPVQVNQLREALVKVLQMACA